MTPTSHFPTLPLAQHTSQNAAASAQHALRHASGWLTRLLGRAQATGASPIESLDLATLNPHLQRDLNVQGWTNGWAQTRRELDRYEQHKAGLPVRPFL